MASNCTYHFKFETFFNYVQVTLPHSNVNLNLTSLNRIYTRKLKHVGLSMRPNFVACPTTNLLNYVLNYILYDSKV